MEDQFRRPVMSASLTYDDPKAAINWLERAFGFERTMILATPDGAVVHAEMKFAGGSFHLGGPWGDHTASPKSVGKTTQSVQVLLIEGSMTIVRGPGRRPPRSSASRRISSTATASMGRSISKATIGASPRW